MNPESSEDQLEHVKSEIRADADVARSRAPLPARATLRIVEVLPIETGPSIAELARHAGPAFVDHAYRTILRREPDPAGFARQMDLLAAGANKIEIIGDLRYSAEGRRVGTHIPGLRPRYVIGKLARVPVLGALVQWLLALVALPHMLRHQRAGEASLAVRFGEVRTALQAAEQRGSEQREQIQALANGLADLSHRIANVETYARAIDAKATELRNLVLAMNHWTVEVRKSIDLIEAAEDERRMREDEAAASLIERDRLGDADRPRRLTAYAEELARRLPAKAIVLDVNGGADWLGALAANGMDASAIETNSALHRAARARGLDVSLGDPLSLLARVADDSIDAMTIAVDRATGDVMMQALIREARRIVRSGGVLLVDMDRHAAKFDPMGSDAALASGFHAAPALAALGGDALLFVRA